METGGHMLPVADPAGVLAVLQPFLDRSPRSLVGSNAST
jgi:hypothetical protein